MSEQTLFARNFRRSPRQALAMRRALSVTGLLAATTAVYLLIAVPLQRTSRSREAMGELETLGALRASQISSWTWERMADSSTLQWSPEIWKPILQALEKSPTHPKIPEDTLGHLRVVSRTYRYQSLRLLRADGETLWSNQGEVPPPAPDLRAAIRSAALRTDPSFSLLWEDGVPIAYFFVPLRNWDLPASTGASKAVLLLGTDFRRHVQDLTRENHIPGPVPQFTIQAPASQPVLIQTSSLDLQEGEKSLTSSTDIRGTDLKLVLQLPDSAISDGLYFAALLSLLPWALLALLAYAWTLPERAKANRLLKRRNEEYSALMDNIDQSYIRTSLEDGVVVRCNPAALRLLGLASERELVGKRLAKDFYVDPSEREAMVAKLHERGIAYLSRTRMRRKEGTIINVDATMRLVRDHRGTPIAVEGLARDVTVQTQNETTLLQERNLAMEFLDLVNSIVVVIDSSARVRLVNRTAAQFLGYEPHEMVGRNWIQLTCPEELREERHDRFRTVFSGQRPPSADYESVIQTRAGERKLVRWNMSLVRTKDGLPDCLVAAGENVTDRTRFEAELKRAAAAREELLKVVTQAIHAPVRAISGLAKLLLESAPSVDRKNLVESLSVSSEALRSVAAVIDELSRIEGSEKEAQLLRFSLPDVCNSIFQALAPKAKDRGIDLSFSIDPTLPDELMGDPFHLIQALTHIGSIRLLATDTSRLLFEIKAHSRGNATIDVIFLVEAGRKLPTEGDVGLRLAIAHRLVTIMGGTLNGEDGRQSFTLKLGVPSAGARAEDSKESRKIRAVLVGSNRSSLDELSDAMRGFTSSIFRATSAEEAIQILERPELQRNQSAPVLIVEDHPPQLDGEALCRKLLELESLAESPRVIVISDEGTRPVGLPEGFIWIQRPYNSSTLLDAVLSGQGRAQFQPPRRELEGRLDNARILLVEDNKVSQLIAREILELAGAQVSIAEDGDEALSSLDDPGSDFDVVIMDLQMPKVNGYTATSRIRRRFSSSALPILAMTAHPLPSERERCLELGINDFISKPVDPVDLLEAVSRWTRPN